jgi:hypothetical protein
MAKIGNKGRLIFFFKEQEELGSIKGAPSSTYYFPHYFQIIFNFLFLLCLSPMWISFVDDQQAVLITQLCFHKVIP